MTMIQVKRCIIEKVNLYEQAELPRNLSSPWLSLGFVGCLEMFVENRSDKKLVDVVDIPDSPA